MPMSSSSIISPSASVEAILVNRSSTQVRSVRMQTHLSKGAQNLLTSGMVAGSHIIGLQVDHLIRLDEVIQRHVELVTFLPIHSVQFAVAIGSIGKG